tara:strand:- start:291 stop:656 length:366 start_codon:yes stop_codon:yes gene_type:complete
MARRTTAKTAAANRRGAKTQPLRTYQTKGGAQQYGSEEDFRKAQDIAFDRTIKSLGADFTDMAAYQRAKSLYESLNAGMYGASDQVGFGTSFTDDFAETQERKNMQRARDSFKRGKFKGTF